MKKEILICVFMFLFLFYPAALSFPQELKLEVIAEKANIYIEPDINSQVVETLEKGAVLTLISPHKKNWYCVSFMSEKKDFSKFGYIQIVQVKIILHEKLEEERIESEKQVDEVKFKLPKKIRVSKVGCGNIRSRPEIESQVIQKVLAGTILYSVAKAGEWFKVNLSPNDEGIVFSGYIHQNCVEEVVEKISDVPKIKEEKTIDTLVYQPEKYTSTNAEVLPESYIGARIGGSMPVEENYVKGLSFGGDICLGITENIAITIGVLSFQSNVVENPDALSIGKLSITSFSLSLKARFPIENMSIFYLLGGGSYYLNNFTLASEIESTWNNLGFDIKESVENFVGFHFGSGIDIFMSKNVAFNVDIRYYILSPEGTWTLTDQVNRTEVSGNLEKLNLNYISLCGGLKFYF